MPMIKIRWREMIEPEIITKRSAIYRQIIDAYEIRLSHDDIELINDVLKKMERIRGMLIDKTKDL